MKKVFVKDLLPELKGHRTLYINLDKSYIADYKKLYDYLNKHKDKQLSYMGILLFEGYKPENFKYLDNYNKMKIISQNINH